MEEKREEVGEAWEGGGKRYRVHKVVGNGAFGIVWRAVEEGVKSETVAIKKVILDRRYHNRELEMMKGMDHDCVIRLLNHFEKPCAGASTPHAHTHPHPHPHPHPHTHHRHPSLSAHHARLQREKA
jgi:serine/threonine protein kinase